MFHGSIGMTYEQASVRGLVAKREDETVMHYRDSVQHHFISSLSTIENTANNREALLKYFYEYRRTAVEEGKNEVVKEYIIAPGNDARRADRFAAMLMNNGIEVKRADAAFTNGKARDYYEDKLESRQFPAGSYVVSLSQPAHRQGLRSTGILSSDRNVRRAVLIAGWRKRHRRRRLTILVDHDRIGNDRWVIADCGDLH